MTALLLIFGSLVAAVLAFIAVRLYRDIRRPSPLAFGCIIPKVCVVSSEEVFQYCRFAQEAEESLPSHLRSEARRKLSRLYRTFLRQMVWNTRLFQRALCFEQAKIDTGKSSLDYEQSETLTVALVDEAADTREQLVKQQLRLMINAILRAIPDYKALPLLLTGYKKIEEDVLALAGMAEDRTYHDMLRERLGLSNWGIMDGGDDDDGPGPETA